MYRHKNDSLPKNSKEIQKKLIELIHGCTMQYQCKRSIIFVYTKNQFSTKRPCQSRVAKLVNIVIAGAIQHPYASKGMKE